MKWLLALILLPTLAGCSVAPGATPALSHTASPSATAATLTVPPSSAPGTPAALPSDTTRPPTSASSPPSWPAAPRFYELHFTRDMSYWDFEPVFPLGTREIYAVWHYENMQPGMVINRTWTVNGEVWIEREEEWDYDHYGQSGWLGDISVFDHVDGLPAGDWQLTVTIDGEPQFSPDATSFTVADLRRWDRSSPDGSRLAWIANERELVVDGVTVVEVSGSTERLGPFDWHPDNRHILVTVHMLGPDVIEGPPGLRYRVWAVNVTTGEQILVADQDDWLHSPRIAPDGRSIAFVRGNGYGDACFSGWGLSFYTLESGFVLSDQSSLWTFSGFPDTETFEDVYPVDGPGFDRPGYWEDETHFIAALEFTCRPEHSSLPGIYRLDVPAQTVERIADN